MSLRFRLNLLITILSLLFMTAVGFVITARPGDWVELGEPMATIFARDRAGVEAGKTALRAAITIADEADPPLPLVSHRVTAAGVELLVGT